jgi:glycosyltransferase involved in cell wall biosynthesis
MDQSIPTTIHPCGEEDNWIAAETPAGGTPGHRNSVFANKPDLIGPEWLELFPLNANEIQLTFSEKLDKNISAKYFSMSPLLEIKEVTFPDQTLRTLSVSLQDSMKRNTTYSLRIEQIRDCNQNQIIPMSRNVGSIEPADSLDVVINEILFNPRPGGVDFVEVVNASAHFIDTRNWSIATASQGPAVLSGSHRLLAPGEFAVYTSDPTAIQGQYPSANTSVLYHVTLPALSDDDKYFAYVHMSQAHQNLGNVDMAISCCNEALSINTKFPDAWLRLGELYLHKEQYSKAIDWIEIGIKKEKPDTMMVLDTSVYSYRPLMNLALAWFYLGDYGKAWDYFCRAEQIAPNNDFVKSNKPTFTEAVENDKYFKNLAWIVAYTQDKDPEKLPKLVEALPKTMMKDERILTLKNKYAAPVKWDADSVVIYCGPAWEDWAAPSVLNGIGGSEEAVIYVSKELVKLGKKVTVFCSCGDLAGEYEGVVYRDHFEFNPHDIYDVLIAWRHNVYTYPIKARRKIIWMHDVPDPNMFPEDSIENIDAIMVLSQFHKTLLPSYIPESKIYVSSNGINLADFNNDLLDRNPKRMIYTSSYDRGLQHLLDMWPDIKKQVPAAELHIFYGWNTYDAMLAKGHRDAKFKNDMVALMKQDGVFEHGRIGHKQLAKEFAKSGIYAYPSHFEEISCISAMKAQAALCVPVVTNYAALAETVKFGVKIDGKAGDFPVDELFCSTLVDMLNDTEKQEAIRKEMLSSRDQWGWDKVAKKWVTELFV